MPLTSVVGVIRNQVDIVFYDFLELRQGLQQRQGIHCEIDEPHLAGDFDTSEFRFNFQTEIPLTIAFKPTANRIEKLGVF